jgi:DNA-formamidopyrimidine glycosylase
LLVGKCILNAFVGKSGRYVDSVPAGFSEFIGELRGRGACRVTEVGCKGKFMWWTLGFSRAEPRQNEDPWHLWITYGMSGQWSSKETKHSGFGIYYNDTGSPLNPDNDFVQPSVLYFNDSRHFGTLKFVHSNELHQKKLVTLGPDMLSDPPTWQEFMGRILKRPKRTLAEALMDQGTVSGVGNYVKAEALYLSELSPHRACDSLSMAECERLRKQITNVMRASYNTGGATIRTYRNVDGTEGGMQRRFAVYGNQTDPMGNPVVKEETKDGRTTHWCPTVQH